MKDRLSLTLPELQQADERFRQEFDKHSHLKHISRGEYLAFEGDCDLSFYILLKGIVRVYKASEAGREITVYKVSSGESCILSAFALFSRTPFLADAIAEEDSVLLQVSGECFRDWMNRCQPWREYVFSLLSTNLTEIINKLQSLVFQRVDERIAEYLVRETGEGKLALKATHSEIAREIGTAREVVSRILRNFEKAHMVVLSRGNITVLDEKALLNCGKMYCYAG